VGCAWRNSDEGHLENERGHERLDMARGLAGFGDANHVL